MQKEEKVNTILELLKKSSLFSHIKSIYVYGSFFTAASHKSSDIDILIILDKRIELLDLYEVSNITKMLSKLKIKSELNIVDVNNISFSKEKYWHNTRGLVFIEEIKRFGKLIQGEDVFKKIKYTKQDLFIECKKVILSLTYNIKKSIIKIKSSKHESRDLLKILKFSCYLTNIMMFAYLPKIDLRNNNHYDEFDKYFQFSIKSKKIFNLKRRFSKDPSGIQSSIKELFNFSRCIEDYIIKNEP